MRGSMPSQEEEEQLSCLRIEERREDQKNLSDWEQRRPKRMPACGSSVPTDPLIGAYPGRWRFAM